MDAIKVTDPTKMVTDPVLLAHLERQGIDKDYVELTSDYEKAVKGKSSPYAKFYRDLKSDKQFMVITQLPMVDHEGKAVEVGWQKTDNGFAEKSNLFKADVSRLQVTLTVRNDQPDGRKAGQQVIYRPQLFLDGIEKEPSDATLLDIDPLNENYTDNTLEWDYGICKRRLRIIEGKLLGSWVFDKNPGGEVRIKYNQSGDFKLKLGQYAVSDDEELITKEQFDKATYTLTVSDSATFYPDAHPESTTVDGRAYQYLPSGDTWANIRGGAGNGCEDSVSPSHVVQILAYTTNNVWSLLTRAIYLFDTSALPDGATISAATMSIRGSDKLDNASWAGNLNVYSSNPTSNTALANGDYTTLGTTPFCDTPITYAGYSLTGYNDFALNAAGIAAISKTGITKLGLRNANYDVANTAPTWVNGGYWYLTAYYAEGGTGYKPKLVVTYTAGETKTSGDSGSGAEAISLRGLGIVEIGSGVEASLAAATILASDGGSGSEMGGLLKGLFSQDEGGGADSMRILTGKAGYDLKLHPHGGQVSITHKEVNL
ncbi:MAG: hypothetical protein ABR954_00040 [Dehalococcoidales bacterium]